ncbi:DUF975 family protein [Bdellovibrio svalbardensis]|uniref:hypothetical protein n=1 Tax=Bdellovibrio svalbardensis TaxID=2972972 RepID=UPI00240846AC|nr:hypothetical protein [Bdellovibrio svalbardensis]
MNSDICLLASVFLTHLCLLGSIYVVNFFAENLKVFKKAALPLFALVVVSNNIDQYLNMQVETALQNPMGANGQVYFFGFLSIVSSVIFPVLLATTALYAMVNTKPWESLMAFFGKFLNQVFIESLRAWGKTLLWSLLFIIPGIWKYLELSLVPFVVTSSESYEAGKIDALQASSYVFRKHWFKILGILFCFHLFLPLILTSFFDSYRLLWKTPLASLFLSLLDTYLILISTQLLFNVFQSEVSKHDSHV